MTDGSLADALEREHRAIDEGLLHFVDGGDPGQQERRALADAMAALRRHIYLEEELLFPRLREAGLAMPVFVMVREHAQMWRLLDDIDKGLAGEGDASSVRDLVRELMPVLDAHNPKEEQILYPQVQHVLDDAASSAATAVLRAGGLPDGWVCEGL